VGVFDKMKFWDKKEPEVPAYDLGAQSMGSMEPHPLEQPGQESFNPQGFQQQSYPQYPSATPFPGSPEPEHISTHDQTVHPRDIELILAKLDAIKAELDSLHQRVRKIEQVTEPQQKKYW
jgi:hypothetical protein